ncbi:MAG: hypothetical protein LUD25_01600 [Coriobacteriaceae bacterium]|nr:hypothetical protein [Coriobacteriaceae bacterium]
MQVWITISEWAAVIIIVLAFIYWWYRRSKRIRENMREEARKEYQVPDKKDGTDPDKMDSSADTKEED